MKWMLNILVAAALCTTIGGVTTGCGGTKTPQVPLSEPEALKNTGAPINLLNKNLRKAIGSEIQEADRLEDGRMNVLVVLRNRTSKLQHIQVRTVFKDERNISTGDETAWNDLYLDPMQVQTLRSESKTSVVEKYTVEIRRPPKVKGKRA